MTASTARLLARTTSKLASVSHPSQQAVRSFAQTCRRREDERPRGPSPSLIDMLTSSHERPVSSPISPPRSLPSRPEPEDNSSIKRALATTTLSRAMNIAQDPVGENLAADEEDMGPAHEPFHFHVYSHKHNTHVTVTKPNRNPIISMSTGNIGFKKSKRSSYDAAYQLCAYVLDKLNQGGWHRRITSLEVVLRGFGSGREACTKVLLGNEGRLLRPHIKKVSDDTKLKFGGTRSPRPKRLG